MERAATALYIADGAGIKNHRLDQSYLFSDKAIRNVSSWHHSSEMAADLKVSIRKNRQRLLDNNLTLAEDVAFYNGAVAGFFRVLVSSVKDTPSLEAWHQLLAYRLLVLANEDYSAAGLLGLEFFHDGSLSSRQRNEFVRLGALGADHVKLSQQYSTDVQRSTRSDTW